MPATTAAGLGGRKVLPRRGHGGDIKSRRPVHHLSSCPLPSGADQALWRRQVMPRRRTSKVVARRHLGADERKPRSVAVDLADDGLGKLLLPTLMVQRRRRRDRR